MVKCLKQGTKSRNSVLNRVGKSDFCLKRGQGMMGRAAPPHATKRLESERAKVIFFYISVKLTTMVGA